MITPNDVPHLATKAYQQMLASWLRGESYIPVHWKVGQLPTNPSEHHAACLALAQGAKASEDYGYTVQWRPQRTRAKAARDIPQTLYAETWEDLLALADKQEEFSRFRNDVAIIRTHCSEMEVWLQTHPLKVVAHTGSWEHIVQVVAYIVNHPWPTVEIRALPVAADTKFIERHTGILRDILDAVLPPEAINRETHDFVERYGFLSTSQLVRIRALDHQFSQQHVLPGEDITMPLPDATLLQLRANMVIIVENLHTFLKLPASVDTIALWGAGFAARNLASLPWLQSMRVLYWGDLDAQGFEILSQFRSVVPHTESLLMEASLLDTMRKFIVSGTPTLLKSLQHLTQEEHATYVRLVQNGQRLEQERIPLIHLHHALYGA